MKRFICIGLSIFFIIPLIIGQDYLGYRDILARNLVLTGKKKTKSKLDGSFFHSDEWQNAKINIDGEEHFFEFVKFNIVDAHLEIQFEEGVKIMDNKYFTSFSFINVPSESNVVFWKNHYFYYEGKKLYGIVQATEIQDHRILKTYDPNIREFSKENPLMLKEMDRDEVRLNEKLYFEYDGVLEKIFRPKDVQKYFSSHKNEIKDFMKREDIDVKKVSDLIKVIEYFYVLQDRVE